MAIDRLPSSVIAIMIVLLMFGAVWFSVSFLLDQSLRLDEAQSLWQTSHSPQRILQIIGEDVHVPLYHMTLHGWLRLFGDGVAAARMLSLLFFVLTLPLLYLLGREVGGRRGGLFVAVLGAVSPFLHWYGSEIRMYSMLGFLAAANQLFFLKLWRSQVPAGTWRSQRLTLTGREARSRLPAGRQGSGALWAGYVLSAIAGMYTHYFFALVLIGQALFGLLHRAQLQRILRRRLMLTAAVVSVALLPWVIYIFRLGGIANTRPLLTPPSSINLFNTYNNFLFGFHEPGVNTMLIAFWPLVLLFSLLVLSRHVRISPAVHYLFLAAAIPPIAAFVISLLIRPFYETRYLIIAVPALYAFLAWMFSAYSPKIGQAVRILLPVLMLVFFLRQATNAATPVKEDFRDAVAHVEAFGTPRDALVVSPPFTVYPVEYYYRGSMRIHTLPEWDRLTEGPIPPFIEPQLPEEAEAIVGSHERLWLVLSYDQGYEDAILGYFDSHYERIEEQQFSEGITLYAYQLRPAPSGAGLRPDENGDRLSQRQSVETQP